MQTFKIYYSFSPWKQENKSIVWQKPIDVKATSMQEAFRIARQGLATLFTSEVNYIECRP